MNRHDVMSVSPPTPDNWEPSPLYWAAVIIPEAFMVPKLECNWVLIPGTVDVETPVKSKLVAVTTPATDSPVPTIIPWTPSLPTRLAPKVETPAVTIKPPVVALNPLPAVIIPTESTLVTSS